MSYKYSLKYSINLENKKGGYLKEDATKKYGLTDCFIGVSILLPEDGSYSQCIVVADNAKERRSLTPQEIFKFWMTLGLSLYDDGFLTGWHHEFVERHSELAREIVKKIRMNNES